jgi:hypothetical protein
MKSLESDLEKVIAHTDSVLGPPNEWKTKWPGGWPGDIESALVDAVFSARAVYRTASGRGIYANVTQWQAGRGRQSWSVDALIADIDKAGIDQWAAGFRNGQHSPTRPPSAPGGPTKAATVRQAAGVLRELGVNEASQIDLASTGDVKQALVAVPGIGMATVNYFLMLLGAPGVKPDRMVHRFLYDAAQHSFTNAQAEEVVTAAAGRLGVPANELDHTIWRYESDKAARQVTSPPQPGG